METKALEEKLAGRLAKQVEFAMAFKVVKSNSHGKIWLIGGALVRNLAVILHGGTVSEHDFDFIVERAVDKFNLPEGWIKRTNRYGNPKFETANLAVDYIPLQNIHSIKRRGLEPTIENFLSGTPFDVQALAYDIQTREILGTIGLQALQNKIFGINNLEQARIFAEKKGLPLDALIKQKAASMKFEPVMQS